MTTQTMRRGFLSPLCGSTPELCTRCDGKPHNGLGARSAPKRRCANQPRGSAGISSGGARWLVGVALLGLLVSPREAAAQLDPLLFLKRVNSPSTGSPAGKPNVLIMVDTNNRMQRDTNGDYLDDNVYLKTGAAYEAALLNAAGQPLGVFDDRYRRKFVGLQYISSGGGDRFSADHIEIVRRTDATFNTFDDYTRMSIARRGVKEAITRNSSVVRFGLLKTRQNNPRFVTPASAGLATKWNINEGPVIITNNVAQQATGDSSVGKWKVTRPITDGNNGAVAGPVAPLVKGDSNVDSVVVGNTIITNYLNPATGVVPSLIPDGRDQFGTADTPLDYMLDDLRAEALRLITLAGDTEAPCRNTVAVLIAGGGNGNTSNAVTQAKINSFLNVSQRRVPIHVIGIAPLTAGERDELQNIATSTGGKYTEITAAMVDATTSATFVPELVNAINFAVSHSFADQGDFDLAPSVSNPYGQESQYQVTSPIVGSVNLEGASDINNNPLPDTRIENPTTGTVIPQRSNIMITSGFSLPGFGMKLQAVRVYKPVADSSKAIGYKFVSDGTKLWVASAPAAASRNIYTTLSDGTMIAFTPANAATLAPYLMKVAAPASPTNVLAAASLIDYIRNQPLGAIVDSTPAIMDPPSLDPPPDVDYPSFIDANKDRRSMIWVGANDGMLHGIDARLGKEVWAFIPFNLLPKLMTLKSGQPVGDFRYFVDGSPKIADVKVGGNWRTYLVMGEGPGGTFYQTFDVTLPDMSSTVMPDSDDLNSVLSYFNSASSVPLKWAFPSYSQFNWTYVDTARNILWGDLFAAAPAVSKTVGQTWSDPAIGQISTNTSRFTVLTGSGFFPYSAQQSANRGGAIAGNAFYLLDISNGNVLDSRSVGNDNKGETIDNCVLDLTKGCTELKNALQADPVATGPADSRFITKAYLGDLDGKIWRFDLTLNSSGVPSIQNALNLYSISTGNGSKASDHPIFSSMATVSIGSTQQYLFVGTGSDLLPSNKVSVSYGMFVILDQGATGSQTAMIQLEKVDGANGEEKVTSFPAVAGDIVFFSSTTYKVIACAKPDANLYAFTFIGGPAYDTNNDGKMNNQDTTKVRTTAGARATAPFIVDQHLVFGTGKNVEQFGDPQDFNNGVGQAGVRILSWREDR
jgi:PilC-like protein with beta-propeller domain